MSLITVSIDLISSYKSMINTHRANKDGQWRARFGRFDGKRDLYLGTFSEYIFLNILN